MKQIFATFIFSTYVPLFFSVWTLPFLQPLVFITEGMYCSIKRDSTFLTVMTKTQGLSSEVLSLRAIIIKLLLVAVACTVQGFAVGVREAPLKILAPFLTLFDILRL